LRDNIKGRPNSGAGKPPLPTSENVKGDIVADGNTRLVPWATVFVIGYVVLALGVDSLVASRVQWPFPWSRLDWDLSMVFPSLRLSPWAGFDVFKFLFWFVVPFAICLPGMNWKYLLRGPWKKWDLILVGALAAVGMGVMFLIPLVPALSATYLGHGTMTPEQKTQYFLGVLAWNLSWLPGWEFMHRYMLLGAAQRSWPRWGWLLVPLSETLYHLQKPGIEALGMMAFSVVLTFWCMKRGNWLLGFVVHLIIEVELLIFLTMIA
jgi:hypothetical protein